MKGLTVIYRRELAGLFVTPLGWVLFLLAVVLKGIFITLYLQLHQGAVNPALRADLGDGIQYWLLMALLPPLLTMRMLSEESRSGMLEFLLTAPVTDAAVVLGKVLAATTFMVLLWSTVIVYALTFEFLGAPPDWGQVWAGLVGSVLVSALFCSIGMAVSAVVNAPILAAFLAFLANVGVLTLSFVVPILLGPSYRQMEPVLDKVAVAQNLAGSFLRGVFDSSNAVFFVAWTLVFLVLATRILEARRWW